MKFPQFPIGQRFAYRGEVYTKVGPMTARRERDGEQRLIPRSAAVFPAESPTVAARGRGLDEYSGPGHWSAALDAYEGVLRAGLEQSDGRPSQWLDPLLERARAAFLAALRERP
jgi:hypothetical protein